MSPNCWSGSCRMVFCQESSRGLSNYGQLVSPMAWKEREIAAVILAGCSLGLRPPVGLFWPVGHAHRHSVFRWRLVVSFAIYWDRWLPENCYSTGKLEACQITQTGLTNEKEKNCQELSNYWEVLAALQGRAICIIPHER